MIAHPSLSPALVLCPHTHTMSFHSPFGNPSPGATWGGGSSLAGTAWSPAPSPGAASSSAAAPPPPPPQAWHPLPPPTLPLSSALTGLGWAEASDGCGGCSYPVFAPPPPPPQFASPAPPYHAPPTYDHPPYTLYTFPPPRPSPPWARPSGPRGAGVGCEDSAQGLVSADTSPSGGVILRVTLLAAGFVIGPGGASVRDLCRASGADVRSSTERASPSSGHRPVRAFVVEGPPAAVAAARALIAAAVDRYVELTDGRAAGALVPRAQVVAGITFSYQPPPKAAVPGAAGLKGSPRRVPPPPPFGRGGGVVAAVGGGVWSPPHGGAVAPQPPPGGGARHPSRSRDMLAGLLHRLADEDGGAAAAQHDAAATQPQPRALRTSSAPPGLLAATDDEADTTHDTESLASFWHAGEGGGGGGGGGDTAPPPSSAVAALRLLLTDDDGGGSTTAPGGLPPRGPGRPALGALPAGGEWASPPPRAEPLAPRALAQPLARVVSAPGPVAAAPAPWVKGGHPLWPE